MSQRKRAGRPPGSNGGRQRQVILTAARELFADEGFRGTTMRAVAARAGVDVSLVAHYFTNKQGLFAATLQLPAHAKDEMLQAMAAAPEQRGRELTQAFLGLWEAPETGEQLRVVARTALSSRELGRRTEGVLVDIFTNALSAGATEAPHTTIEVAWTQLLGVAIARYLLQLPTVANLPLDDLVDLVAPGVQTTLDQGVSVPA